MGGLSIAHNGNLTNALILREELVKDGAIFRTTAILRLLSNLLQNRKERNLKIS